MPLGTNALAYFAFDAAKKFSAVDDRLPLRPVRHRRQVPQLSPLAHVPPAPRNLHQGPTGRPHACSLRRRARL
jgi:hypothetical protein